MAFWTVTGLLGLSFAAGGQVIDEFQYASASAAGQVWQVRAERGTAVPVSMVSDQGRPVLELVAPFASQPKLGRIYMDRKIDLDLAAAGGLELDMWTDDPASMGRISLYFHSRRGWYAAGKGLDRRDWQTLRFSKAAFTQESGPAGWDKVDTIRIAVWRGQPKDIRVRIRRLASVQNDVALVIPSANSHVEYRSALTSSEDVGQMLSELGLGSDAIEDTAISKGALGKRRVAILAYNPRLSAPAIKGLTRFVEEGGKILICYQLPGALGEALGFGRPKYVRQDAPGQFAEIRFQATDIDALPSVLRQASWNITSASPIGFNAREIAYWFDDQGKPTGHPAMLLSDRGAFFSHIILGDDRGGKKRMLASILGHLDPLLWKTMADKALAGSGRVGHFEKVENLVDYLKHANRAEIDEIVANTAKQSEVVTRKYDAGAYAEVVTMASEIHASLVHAYLLAQPSRSVEGRAYWNHTGTGAYAGDWRRTARELTEAGFNMILPNMLWGGRAHYASDVLPRSTTFQKHGDQIAQCVKAAKEFGLQVHVWKVNWNLSGAPQTFVRKIHAEERNQVSVDGKAHDWLCPSHPKNFELELQSLLEVARNYEVDGLHFDYIRYPGRDKCYCDGCRSRFQSQTGNKVSNWPKDCYSGPLREAYTQWRCDQITRLVQAVHDKAKAMRPEIEISAAVFGAYPSCRESVAQDWPQWIKAGYLDFVCPMNYTQSDLNFISLVTNQLRLVDGRIPLYPGIGQWRLSSDRTVGQIHHAPRLGAAGFTLFDLSRESVASAVPAVGLGVGREKADAPHRKSSGGR